MHRVVHRPVRDVAAFALLIACLAGLPAYAAPQPAGIADGIIVTPGDGFALATDAPPAPVAFGGAGRFGSFISDAIAYPHVFDTLRVAYETRVPRGAQVALDVRTSADDARWTPWVIDLAPGATARFDQPARFAQYRVRLLATGDTPLLRSLRLTPERSAPSFAAFENEPPPVAPTFTVHATRLGLVGRRTANGHRIVKRDRFVALPCVCVLSSRGGSEYMVRITHNGRSVVAPVYDVGPWNTRDNYWDPQEKRYFSDLRQGWPQDHAAFFEGHNNGRAQHGRVRFPTAIDIADGIWWDDFGIKGDRAVVDVTFLWMGRDPLEQAAQPQSPPEMPPADASPDPPSADTSPAPSPADAPPADVPGEEGQERGG
ncbi:hypothetical protein [Roseiflexus sp.]|uniref:hypothetical protein n=1 Tax=Roseiflexus sp. TaxID=2562120 RepID=UPI0021DDB1E7|nr:hypothetical protein [Roseiflexus sp.]GIW00207.1 MAG: hypothetical protein KatS3mg058_1610 [Roseiflexus sp.]